MEPMSLALEDRFMTIGVCVCVCVCVCVRACAHAQALLLSCPTDCSPSGSSAHEIFQARILEWGNKRSHFNEKPSQYKEE